MPHTTVEKINAMLVNGKFDYAKELDDGWMLTSEGGRKLSMDTPLRLFESTL
jgi:hypothetical protein